MRKSWSGFSTFICACRNSWVSIVVGARLARGRVTLIVQSRAWPTPLPGEGALTRMDHSQARQARRNDVGRLDRVDTASLDSRALHGIWRECPLPVGGRRF